MSFNIETATAQEVFNQVAYHLFNQGKRAYAADACLYRAPDGSRCAVGCLISDAMYDPSIEGWDVCNLIADTAEDDNGDSTAELRWPQFQVFAPHEHLLTQLQSVHDVSYHWHTTREMRNALDDVAIELSLDASILETLSFKDR